MEELLSKIRKDIEEVKVVYYQEEKIASNSEFVDLKRGYYQLNNGHTINRESIFKKNGSGNAVCIFAVTIDKKILIVVQPRASLPTESRVNVELPAGYTEMGEDTVLSGKRELEEETGYSSDNMMVVDSYYTSPGISGERIDLVLAIDCVKIGEQHLDKDEFICYEEVTLEEFKYLLSQKFIVDANARIGYYKYMEYLKEGEFC